jgi:hypothetical protein
MHKFHRSWGFLIYSLFIATIASLILGEMLLSPSEPTSAVALGLSLPRLVLTLGLFAIFVFFAFLSVRVLRDWAWAEATFERWFGQSSISRVVICLAVIGLGLGLIGCFLPAYRAGVLGVHWDRMRPAMIFLLLASTATLIVILLKRSHTDIRHIKNSNTYKLSLILFVPTIIAVGVMFVTDFGVYAPEDYWYGAGVPILVTQLMTAILGGIFFLWAEKKWNLSRWDVLVFFVIYVIAAIFWAREPLQKSFLFIGPYAPNRVLYPFADAAIFDTASQFALIGRNFFIFNGQFFERALYISFLTYLHSLVGQDYQQLMAAQAVIFAIFPALVYLVGRSLNSRAIGFAAAIVALFRGGNSIAASNMIDMANPKMMLTDFPTAIGIALIVLFMCEWLRKPQQKWYYALWIGGVVGLTIMLRTNTLVLLLFIPLYAILNFPRERKIWITSSFFLLLAVFAITLPWELRNQSLGGKMYESIFAKFENVFQRRYAPPSDSLIPQKQKLSFVSFKSTQVLGSLSPQIDIIQVGQSCQQIACFVSNHFLHNIVTSVLVLPTSPRFDDLRHTVKETYPYWQPDWNGSFSGLSFFFFVLNIFLIVLGITVAWQHHRLTGLSPLAIFMFYNMANGFARTSGGRYIVPIDWILILYFLIGVFQTIILFANVLGIRWTLFEESTEQRTSRVSVLKNDLARALMVLLILFGVGALIPLAETLHADRYENFDATKALSEREEQLSSAGLSLQEVNSFLQNPNAEISIGRALYPRYYIENEGEVHFYPVVVMGFPRTTFTLIGHEGEKGIVLPGEKPGYFPHAVDTIVLGCKEPLYVDALAVIVLDEKGAVYTRSPASPLQCPLQQPVCDNNHNCY